MSAAKTLDAASVADARAMLLRCCGCTQWVDAMLGARPFGSDDALRQRAAEQWARVDREGILEALSHHPRIGENLDELRAKYTSTASWAANEQAGAAHASEATLLALRDANVRYQARFGHIFVVCATGKSAAEMLAILESRMTNDPETELRVAAAEQAKITFIRLEKLAMSTTEKSPITTHVLDTALGKPARGVAVTLACADEKTGEYKELARGETDADGRVTTLLRPGTLTAGTYRISFSVASYFAATQRASFYPEVDIVFVVAQPSEHYHVPLLLSPYGYSTYRGS